MTFEEYELKVAVAVHERTGCPLYEAEAFVGNVVDLYNANVSVSDAADELLAEATP